MSSAQRRNRAHTQTQTQHNHSCRLEWWMRCLRIISKSLNSDHCSGSNSKNNQTKRIFLKRQRKNSLDTTVISPPQWIQWIEFVLFGKWFLYLLLLSLCIVASLWNLSILPWAFCHSPPFSLQLPSFIRCTPTDRQTIQWIVLPSSIVDSVMFMMACIYLKNNTSMRSILHTRTAKRLHFVQVIC